MAVPAVIERVTLRVFAELSLVREGPRLYQSCFSPKLGKERGRYQPLTCSLRISH